MKTILIVEDDLNHQALLADIFSGRCHVKTASSLQEAQRQLESGHLDLVILDVSLPDGEGFKLCPYILQKKELCQIPIIFLTGKVEIDNKLLAFSLGAHDYIVKPYDKRELIARVMFHLDRDNKQKEDAETYKIGDLKFSLPLQKVYILAGGDKEVPIELTGIEFKMLFYFAKHEEHLLNREQLIEALWGHNVNITDRTIDTHISHIRKKLKISLSDIESVYGEGYRFVAQCKKKQKAG